MKRCLNAVTTGRPPDLRAWLQLAGAHGFAGVEFNAAELERLVQAEGLDAARELQAKTSVALAAFGLPVNWQGDADTFRAELAHLDRLAGVAAAAGCARAATWIPPAVAPGVNPALWALEVVRRLRACCEVLGAHGVRLAIEWVGTPTLRTGKVPFLWTAEHAVALCDAIGLPNAGLLVDSWHWYTTGGSPADLERVPAARIVHVHVNDAPERPVDEQLDNVRLLPGASGVIDLVSMLRTLERKGYDGYLSIETFSQEIPRLGPEKATAMAAKAFSDTMARVAAGSAHGSGGGAGE